MPVPLPCSPFPACSLLTGPSLCPLGQFGQNQRRSDAAAVGLIWGQAQRGLIWGQAQSGLIWGQAQSGLIWGQAQSDLTANQKGD
ncbi:hypothetical protein N9D23_11235 [Rubripirellula sp.]|nr:hypothetical protein [Rubripirellula sp.]